VASRRFGSLDGAKALPTLPRPPRIRLHPTAHQSLQDADAKHVLAARNQHSRRAAGRCATYTLVDTRPSCCLATTPPLPPRRHATPNVPAARPRPARDAPPQLAHQLRAAQATLLTLTPAPPTARRTLTMHAKLTALSPPYLPRTASLQSKQSCRRYRSLYLSSIPGTRTD